MTLAIFILGAPGIGKTTLVREFLAGEQLTFVEKPKWTLASDFCAAGHYKGTTFDGGDTVPYTGAADALEYWSANLLHLPYVIFDGDRFSTRPSLEIVSEHAQVIGFHLHADDNLLDDRREERMSNQNETWMRGRVTKARNFATVIQAHDLDASATPGELAEMVRAAVRRAL